MVDGIKLTNVVVFAVKVSAKPIGVEKFKAKLSVERLTSYRVPAGFVSVDHVTVNDE